jgi:hypothetical protein
MISMTPNVIHLHPNINHTPNPPIGSVDLGVLPFDDEFDPELNFLVCGGIEKMLHIVRRF